MPWVRDGSVDFALSSVPVTASDPALEHVTLYFGKMAVVARAGHPLAARRGLTLAELADYPWAFPGGARWSAARSTTCSSRAA